MDAIMLALVAVALANADGRTGAFLSDLLNVRRDPRVVTLIFFGAFLVNALVAAAFGAIANRLIGQGVVALLVAMAMLSAAVALLWRRPAASEAAGDTAPVLLAGRMLVTQFGDRSHFLIGVLAATSGSGLWAAAGGTVGWILAMLPFLASGAVLAERRAARLIRWGAALILTLWGARTALGAFGLL